MMPTGIRMRPARALNARVPLIQSRYANSTSVSPPLSLAVTACSYSTSLLKTKWSSNLYPK